MDAKVLITDTCIEKTICLIRGRKVILDADLAVLYGVSTKRLNEQVKRNKARFPQDFLFQLLPEETDTLMRSRSQFATLKRGQPQGEPIRSELHMLCSICFMAKRPYSGCYCRM